MSSFLDGVLTSFEQVGMTLKLSKCNFAKSSVKFLGHIIGSQIRQPILDRVKAIRDMPEPSTKKLLRSFLGCIGFYKQYIKNYSLLALPLTELTKDRYSNTVKFNDAQRQAFVNLKEALCNFTTLHAPRYDRSFILRTDASCEAVGGCLSQLDDEGKEFPIAFVSAKLTESQRLRPIIENEAFALIYCLKRLDVYIYQSKLDVYMDHNPLQYIANSLPHSPRLTRWSLSLSRYDLKIHYIQGRFNVVADALSRNH